MNENLPVKANATTAVESSESKELRLVALNPEQLLQLKRPNLSISALDTLSKCGQMFVFSYIERLKWPPGVALLVGRGVDQSVDSNLTEKINTGHLLTPEQVADGARDAFLKEWDSEGEIGFGPEEKEKGLEKVKGEAVDKTVRLSSLHAVELAPVLEPVQVQRRWTLELPGFPFDIKGRIDIQEPEKVRDTKTSGKSPARDAADTSDQLTLYSMAVYALDHKLPEEVALDFLVDTKSPKSVSRSSKRTKEDFQVMLNRIDNAASVIEKEAFTPARQDDWWCSERWCGYTKICPYFRKSARPTN